MSRERKVDVGLGERLDLCEACGGLFEDVPAHKAARGKYGCTASNPDGAWARAQADYDQNDPGKPRKLPKRVKRVAPEDMVGLE